MARHVAYVRARGLPTPWRLRDQRQILAGLAERYRPLDDGDGGSMAGIRPYLALGFSLRTSPEDAVAALVAHLDAVDPRWRAYLKIRDGYVGRRGGRP